MTWKNFYVKNSTPSSFIVKIHECIHRISWLRERLTNSYHYICTVLNSLTVQFLQLQFYTSVNHTFLLQIVITLIFPLKKWKAGVICGRIWAFAFSNPFNEKAAWKKWKSYHTELNYSSHLIMQECFSCNRIPFRWEVGVAELL